MISLRLTEEGETAMVPEKCPPSSCPQLLQDVLTWHLFPAVPECSLRGYTRASGTCHFLEDNHKANPAITQRPRLSTSHQASVTGRRDLLGLWVDMWGLESEGSNHLWSDPTRKASLPQMLQETLLHGVVGGHLRLSSDWGQNLVRANKDFFECVEIQFMLATNSVLS